MKYLFSAIILFGAATANAQDLMSRINALEKGNADILSRMASVESKIDALSAKVDKLATPVTPAVGSALTYADPVSACSSPAVYYYSSGSSCGSASDACGASASGSCESAQGSFMSRGPIRRFLFGGRLRGGSGGCGG